MKDYKLSEIKEICKKYIGNEIAVVGCKNCPIYNICFGALKYHAPSQWEIENKEENKNE